MTSPAHRAAMGQVVAEEKAHIYTSGLAARAQGYPLSFNPNCLGSAAHHRWARQWHKENDRLASLKFERPR